MGGEKLTDFDMLRAAMEDSGMPTSTIAERSGIERTTFYNRLNGKGEFKASEIESLARVLKLTKAKRDAIFFAS